MTLLWPTTEDEAREIHERPTVRPYSPAPATFDEESTTVTRPRMRRALLRPSEVCSESSFEKALAFARSFPADANEQTEARESAIRAEAKFLQRIGPLDGKPRVLIGNAELYALSLDHRAAFVLSQIDGQTSYESLMDLTAMPPFETLAVIDRLLELGVIG